MHGKTWHCRLQLKGTYGQSHKMLTFGMKRTRGAVLLGLLGRGNGDYSEDDGATVFYFQLSRQAIG